MTRSTRTRLLAATAALMLGGALGACSSNDDQGADGGQGATTTATGDGEATATDKVDIVDFAFKPADAKVAVGTTVTWTNKDGFDHTVTADDDSFDSGNVGTDGSFNHTFDQAGTFPYICDIHNSMTGSVTVE